MTRADSSALQDEQADRVAIHALLLDYGAMLDRRDFDGFARLFGDDGVYDTGRNPPVVGPAIGPMMREVFATGPNARREPNFHLFFNELIEFDGPDRARSTSMCVFMVTGDDGRLFPALATSYEDVLVRKNGRWLFAQRRLKPVRNRPAEPA
jgi:hypothetical protein